MAKYRVWAECISDVYVDIEAESEERAKEIAEEMDGGEFHDSGNGDWRTGFAFRLDDDADVDYVDEKKGERT